jgi:hypothetical protein
LIHKKGVLHNATKIPGDIRLALVKKTVTFFHGGTIFLPLTVPPSPTVYPTYIEIELPLGVEIAPQSDPNSGYNPQDVDVSDDTLPSGFHRIRLNKRRLNYQYLSSSLFRFSLNVMQMGLYEHGCSSECILHITERDWTDLPDPYQRV